MKLSDIFNINTNTGGGNKLFARIMNKYNVPKREYKEIRKNIENGDGSNSEIEYFKIDYNIVNKNIYKLINILKVEYWYEMNIYYLGCRLKCVANDNVMIKGFCSENNCIKAFSYEPISVRKDSFQQIGIQTDKDVYNFIEIIELINEVSKLIEDPYDLSMKGITPITKEEFYDLNNI